MTGARPRRSFMPRHLQGLRGPDLAVGVILTPLLVPFWVLGWITNRPHQLKEWWWNK